MANLRRFRYIIALMIFCSTFSIYIGRISLSTAIVEMSVNENASKSSLTTPALSTDACPVDESRLHSTNSSSSSITSTEHQVSSGNEQAVKFRWNQSTQGIILGAFFWSYFLFQVPGGRMAERFGAKLLTTVGILGTAIINLVTPIVAPYFALFVASRIVLGAVQAMVFPSAYLLASKWIPDQERSTVLSLTSAGASIGTIVTSAMSGFLCKHGFAGGWPSVFYVAGE